EHRKDAVHPSLSFVAGCERQGSQPCTALEWLQGMVSFGGLDHPPVVAAKGEQNLGAVVRRQHSVEIWQCNAVGAPAGMVGPAKIAGQPGSTHVPTALGIRRNVTALAVRSYAGLRAFVVDELSLKQGDQFHLTPPYAATTPAICKQLTSRDISVANESSRSCKRRPHRKRKGRPWRTLYRTCPIHMNGRGRNS